jgi:hypothetical protein
MDAVDEGRTLGMVKALPQLPEFAGLMSRSQIESLRALVLFLESKCGKSVLAKENRHYLSGDPLTEFRRRGNNFDLDAAPTPRGRALYEGVYAVIVKHHDRLDADLSSLVRAVYGVDWPGSPRMAAHERHPWMSLASKDEAGLRHLAQAFGGFFWNLRAASPARGTLEPRINVSVALIEAASGDDGIAAWPRFRLWYRRARLVASAERGLIEGQLMPIGKQVFFFGTVADQQTPYLHVAALPEAPFPLPSFHTLMMHVTSMQDVLSARSIFVRIRDMSLLRSDGSPDLKRLAPLTGQFTLAETAKLPRREELNMDDLSPFLLNGTGDGKLPLLR